MDQDDFKEYRKEMIEMILSTDMAKHFTDISKFKQRQGADDFAPSEGDKLLCMCMGIHMSDLSNPTKPWPISLKWTNLVYEEFFDQGDKEKELGIPCGPLNDRATINIAKSSVGFIDFIVVPSFDAYSELLPLVEKNVNQLKDNKDKWKELIDPQ